MSQSSRIVFFSMNDINIFMKYNSIKTMTIVTNTGNVMYISKNDKFKFIKAKEAMIECVKEYGDNLYKCVEIFVKNSYNYGIEHSKRG